MTIEPRIKIDIDKKLTHPVESNKTHVSLIVSLCVNHVTRMA